MKNKLVNYGLLVSMMMLLANCAEPVQDPALSSGVQETSGVSINTSSNSQPSAVKAIGFGSVAAGTPMDCTYLNPQAIKGLSEATIRWLATIQPTGITLAENYLVARQTGYNGAFGNGQHIAFQASNPNHKANFEANLRALAGAHLTGYGTFAQHHIIRRNAGYEGLFLCGGDICFQLGQCDSLGRAY